jgi:hypothetical protein
LAAVGGGRALNAHFWRSRDNRGIVEGTALQPARGLEPGSSWPLVGVAEAEPGDGHGMFGEFEQGLQVGFVVEPNGGTG